MLQASSETRLEKCLKKSFSKASWTSSRQPGCRCPAAGSAASAGSSGPPWLQSPRLPLHVAVLSSSAFAGARVLHGLHAPVGEVLVVLERCRKLRGRLLLHVPSCGAARCRPKRSAESGRSTGQVWMPGPPRQWRCGSWAASSGARLPRAARSSVANSLPRSVVTTKRSFRRSPSAPRGARLVATVLAFFVLRDPARTCCDPRSSATSCVTRGLCSWTSFRSAAATSAPKADTHLGPTVVGEVSQRLHVCLFFGPAACQAQPAEALAHPHTARWTGES